VGDGVVILEKEGLSVLPKCVGFVATCPYLTLSPGRGNTSLCLNEFGKVPEEEFDAAALGVAGPALALCHLVAPTILTTAALVQGLRLVVSMEVS
jgi:hypothetical protein